MKRDIKKYLMLLVLAGGLASCNFSGNSDRPAEADISAYQKIVSTYYPAYHLPTEKDKKYDKAVFPIQVFVKGDFNGDGLEDFACICITPLNAKGRTTGKLILFEKRRKNDVAYNPIELESSINIPYVTYLESCRSSRRGELLNSRVHNGKKEDVYVPGDMKGDGLIYGTNEASGALIYWNGGEYKWLWFSD